MDNAWCINITPDIVRNTDNPVIKDVFTRASADEQNHAVWYLYFMTHQ